jgi:enoyl-[acyl-carrier protein] reductase I
MHPSLPVRRHALYSRPVEPQPAPPPTPRTALVFGVATRHSIGWRIAEALHEDGLQVGIAYRRPQTARRVAPLVRSVDAPFAGACDVTDDEAIAATVSAASAALGGRIDVLVHSIANAGAGELTGRFVDTTRVGFAAALDVSAYSLVALARACEPYMPGGGSIVALTAIGSQRVIPHYNVMGVAKAALEASVRYLAADLGPAGIRVNAVSAGSIRTVAAVSVPGFRALHAQAARLTPLRRAVDAEDVARAVSWLASDGARRVTGQIVTVDAGWSILALGGAPPAPG